MPPFQSPMGMVSGNPLLNDISASMTAYFSTVVYVSIEEAQYSIDEDISSVSVCVEIEGRSDSDVVVLLSTENGTALGESLRKGFSIGRSLVCLGFSYRLNLSVFLFTAGRDYIYSSVEVIFGPLEQRTCTDITIIDNNIVGLLRSKSFIVTLQSSNEKVITDMGSATVTIWDNDGKSYVQYVDIGFMWYM